MPTYEYRCKDCGHELEVVQSFTDDALTTCEACGGELRKVFGNVGIAFKGSGFYKTDSRGEDAGHGVGVERPTRAARDRPQLRQRLDGDVVERHDEGRRAADDQVDTTAPPRPTAKAARST